MLHWLFLCSNPSGAFVNRLVGYFGLLGTGMKSYLIIYFQWAELMYLANPSSGSTLIQRFPNHAKAWQVQSGVIWDMSSQGNIEDDGAEAQQEEFHAQGVCWVGKPICPLQTSSTVGCSQPRSDWHWCHCHFWVPSSRPATWRALRQRLVVSHCFNSKANWVAVRDDTCIIRGQKGRKVMCSYKMLFRQSHLMFKLILEIPFILSTSESYNIL